MMQMFGLNGRCTRSRTARSWEEGGRRRRARLGWLAWLLASSAVVGCELIAPFDRDRIPEAGLPPLDLPWLDAGAAADVGLSSALTVTEDDAQAEGEASEEPLEPETEEPPSAP